MALDSRIRAPAEAVSGFDLADGAGVDGVAAEELFDPEQLIVFGHAIGAAERTGFDLTGVGGHRNVADGGVFGFARAMADHGGVTVFLGQFDGVHGLGQRPDLVDLDQDRVGDALVDPSAKEFDIGDEEIVADELDAVAQFVGQEFPVPPIAFGAAVFDADDRVFLAEGHVEIDQLRPGEFASTALFENVIAVAGVELAAGDVQGEVDLFGGFAPGVFGGQ